MTTSVTITAVPTATISYAGTPFCTSLVAGQAVTLSGTGAYTGGTYSSTAGLSINAATGAITPSSSTPGTYTITYLIAATGGCASVPVTTSVTIIALPTATINYAGTPFCTSLATAQSVTLTGTGAYTGGTYSSTAGLNIDGTTGAITPSTSTPGTYTVTYTIPASAGCASVPVTTSVTVTALPTATISYAGTPFCTSLVAGQAVTLTGTGAYTGGTYSSTAGLTIDGTTGAITPGTSTPGTYTVTYTIPASAGCASVPVTTSVTITALPTATISYAGTPFCTSLVAGQAITLSGTGAYTGGTYSSTVGLTIDGTTGAITPSTSTPGTYTVTYTIPASAGCASVPVTTSVTVTAIPTATISYAGTPFCTSLATAQAVTLTGTGAYTGGTYSSTAGLSIDGITGAITPGTSTPGTYTVTYTIPAPAGCASVPVTTSVTVTAVPTATISYTGTPFCTSLVAGQAVTLTGTGAYTGGTYSSTAGLSIDGTTGAITPGTSTPGTYTVTYTIPASAGCASVPVTTTVTVTALPVATFSYDATPYCNDAANPLPAFSGGGTAGTFSSTVGLNFVSTVTGRVNLAASTPGNYVVTNTIAASGGCGVVTSTSGITITALPTATISYAGTPFCSSLATAQPVTLSGTGAYTGGGYSSTAGLSINASTGAITPSSSTPGTYTVTYLIPASGGCATIPVTTNVTITALPTATISYAGTPYCNTVGAGQTVTLTGTSGGIYTSSPVGLNINSVTGSINPSSSTPGIYTVTYTIAAAGGCSEVIASTSVTIAALPTATISYTGATFCTSLATAQSVTLNGTGAYTGGTYSSAAGLSIDGTTGAITPGTSTPGTYTVTYTIPATGGCASVPVTTSVIITALPTATISYAGTPFCTSLATAQSVTLTGTGAYTGGTYSSTVGLTIDGTTGEITPSTSTPGTYTVTYTTPTTGGCSSVLVTTTVIINPLPAANAITGTSAICAGSTLVAYGVTTDNSATASYAWSYSGTNATLSSVTGASITIDFADDATSGILTVIETFTATGCSTTNTYAITVDPLPAANAITGTSAICAGSTLVAYGVTTDNSATASYAWSYSGTNATLSSVTGASITIDFADDATSGILTVVETFTATGCSTTNTYAITVDPLPAANAITGTSAICAGSTLVAYGVTTDNSATASYAWSYSGTNATLSLVTGASITIDFADDATSGILTVVETFTATGCSTTNTYAITVDPLPAANAITGTSAICAGSTLVAYGVTTDNSATASYAWSYSGTNATLSSVTGASITIDFADDATSGILTVVEHLQRQVVQQPIPMQSQWIRYRQLM